MGNTALELVVLILMALLAGCYFDGILVLLPAQDKLSASSYIEVEQANTRLGTIRYRVLIFATLLVQLLFLLTIEHWRSFLFASTLVSMLLIVCATVITVRRVVPINRYIHSWSAQQPPTGWANTRTLWHRYHIWRTALVLLAMLVQFSAIVLIH
jgi:hypothetical protein